MRLIAALLAVAALLPAAPARAAAAPVEPVILVHGWTGSSAKMTMLQEAFTAAGYRAYTIDLPGQDNYANANVIAQLVDQVRAETGAAKVNLVGHSMGGLSTRYYIKRLGGAAYVRSYVSMGTGQHGYLPACLLGEEDGGQMCPSNPFIKDLNAGDDTPGDVSYTALRSAEKITTAYLDGGACLHEIPGVDHKDEPFSPEFAQAAIDAVGGHCPGTFVNLPIG